MNPPDWATHEVVWNMYGEERRVWVCSGTYQYYKGDGDMDVHTHHWIPKDWQEAVSKHGGVVNPIDIKLENE